MAILVFRIVPDTPTSGFDFTAYIENLTIRAFDVSFGNVEGLLIGSASYLPPEDESEPHVPNEDKQIVQHFRRNLFLFMVPQAVATAIIEIPDGRLEHETPDIRIEISRSGVQIAYRQIYYNVPVAEGNLPDPSEFQFQEVTSLYLFLPPPGQQLDPSDAYVELPEDGSPPNFADLRAAVMAVLENDPEAGNFDLAALMLQQSRHIANEMIPNPVHPLPQPPRPLDQLYTEPDEEGDNDRLRFEAGRHWVGQR